MCVQKGTAPPKVRVKNLTFGGVFMTKDSEEFKIKVVTEYLYADLGYIKRHVHVHRQLLLTYEMEGKTSVPPLSNSDDGIFGMDIGLLQKE